MITEIPGIRCGHWTEPKAMTGCSVLLFPPGTVGSAEVRGGAPASRELEALGVGRLVDQIHAAVLTGGSAFGLASADGVMAWCEEHGIGFDTGAALVPIVPTLAIFDLAVGDGTIRPDAAAGRQACISASDGDGDSSLMLGRVGAGTGATIGKWKGADNTRPGGIVSSTVTRGELIVSSLVVVNAFGDIDYGTHDIADTYMRSADDPSTAGGPSDSDGPTAAMTNTTIGVVATNARLDKVGCNLVAQGCHDGLARSIFPPHSRFDGDAFITAATGELNLEDQEPHVDVDTVRLMAMTAVQQAIRSL